MAVEEVNADLKVFDDADIREKIFNYVMCDKLTKKQFYDLIDMMKDILNKDEEKYDEMFDRLNDEIDDSYEKEGYDDFGKN